MASAHARASEPESSDDDEVPAFRIVPRHPSEDGLVPDWKKQIEQVRARSRKQNPDEAAVVEKALELFFGLGGTAVKAAWEKGLGYLRKEHSEVAKNFEESEKARSERLLADEKAETERQLRPAAVAKATAEAAKALTDAGIAWDIDASGRLVVVSRSWRREPIEDGA